MGAGKQRSWVDGCADEKQCLELRIGRNFALFWDPCGNRLSVSTAPYSRHNAGTHQTSTTSFFTSFTWTSTVDQITSGLVTLAAIVDSSEAYIVGLAGAGLSPTCILFKPRSSQRVEF